MPKIEPFEKNSIRYETWFDDNKHVYQSELRAVRAILPETGEGFEIGVGSGRFAAPLGIKFGVDPSQRMRDIASSRGIRVVDGIAEKLPLDNASFDFALMVTTICFVDDAEISLKEAYRVLKPSGYLIIGLIDKDSLIGQSYQKHKHENLFYSISEFFSVDQVTGLLQDTGFTDFKFMQTIFRPLKEISEPEPVKEGYGEGSFVVIRGLKPDS